VTTLRDRLKAAKDLKIFKVDVTTTPVAQPNQPPQQPIKNTVFFGPIARADLDKVIAEAKKRGPGQSIEVAPTSYGVTLFANDEGKIVAGIDDPKKEVKLDRIGNAIQWTYFKSDVKTIEKLTANTSAGATMPPSESFMNVRLKTKPVFWWQFFACIFFGILMAWLFERLTDYYVGLHRPPVQEVANVATAGPAPMIIQGFALAAESSFFNVVAIVACLITPLLIFNPAEYGTYILSFYGIALVGLGLLTTTGYILAMDTFGPISDNAQGVFEMSGCGHGNESATKGIQRLDAAGNTTKALTKGFAIATAVVAAVALFHSFVEAAKLGDIGMRLDIPEIFLGLIIGGAAPFLFSAFSINAVGRAAFQLINDVRDQFRNDPGIMAGTSKPNYGRCVAIVTSAAQRELLGPGILAIALPVAVAFGFSINKPPVEINGAWYNLTGAQALGGFLAGCIVSGQLMAVLLANSGGIWDNAKKLIEDGLHGGKGTEAHKAAVVCDTVGDPFKDTAGPALNPLIKVMNLIALLLAPVIIAPLSNTVLIIITMAAIALLAYAVWFSKRSSIGSEMSSAIGGGSEPKAIKSEQEGAETTKESSEETV
ncbi:MAG: sodium/proton-translocating pyrophosphatase, partial [Chthonomonadaceae bacterium]|nr:sodium/proton-translocating pyrophosphatase [Chthonomonadaceae bacterium]